VSAQRSQAPAAQVDVGRAAEAAVAGAAACLAVRDGGTVGSTPGFGALAGRAAGAVAGAELTAAGTMGNPVVE